MLLQYYVSYILPTHGLAQHCMLTSDDCTHAYILGTLELAAEYEDAKDKLEANDTHVQVIGTYILPQAL